MIELISFTNMIKVSSGVQYILQGLIIGASVAFYQRIGAARRSSKPVKPSAAPQQGGGEVPNNETPRM